mgnify:FL=1
MQKEFCVGKAAESMATASWYINTVAVHFREKNLPIVFVPLLVFLSAAKVTNSLPKSTAFITAFFSHTTLSVSSLQSLILFAPLLVLANIKSISDSNIDLPQPLNPINTAHIKTWIAILIGKSKLTEEMNGTV